MTASIAIHCTRAAGDREAPPISDAMLITAPMAIARGKRFLDDPAQGGYYRTRQYQITVPHRGSAIVPGAWVSVSAPAAGIDDVAMRVTRCQLTLTRAAVQAAITLERYEEP